MEYQNNLDESIERIKELCERLGMPMLRALDTVSDLFELMQDMFRTQSTYFMDKAMQAIAPIVSKKTIDYMLRDKHLHHLHYHRQTCKQLIEHLVAMGIPVEIDPEEIKYALRRSQGTYPITEDTPIPAFTYQGKIYLDTEAIDEEAPLHEYTHLWATALRIAQPDDWARVVRLMQATDIWPYLEKITQGKLTEDQIAEEALAIFSGREGKKRLAGLDIQKANILVQALQLFWSCVCELVGYRFSTAEEVSTQVLSDFLSGTNPIELLLRREQYEQYIKENNLRRDMFIGTIGAQGLDMQILCENRMENLHIAEEMETEGLSPKEIKLATGWERGVDKYWRYEIPSLMVKRKQATAVEWGAGFELQELVDAPELFAAYPDTRHLSVSALPLRRCEASINPKVGIAFNQKNLTPDPTGNLLTTNDRESQLRVRFCLVHELQHYIQYTEGFSLGGNPNRLHYLYLKKKESTLPDPLRNAYDLVRFMRIRGRCAYALKSYTAEEVGDMICFSNSIYPFCHEEKEDREAFARKIAAMDTNEFEETVNLAIEKAETFCRWIKYYEKKAEKIYFNLCGEIEAQNASIRSEIPSDYLRKILAFDTIGIPSNKQYLCFDNEIPTRAKSSKITK